ncbi:MAG: hypothetical protein ACRCVW_03255 [Brevinema sp.]
MKKMLLSLLFLNYLIGFVHMTYAVTNNQENVETHNNSSTQLSKFMEWSLKHKGYDNIDEYTYNHYGMLSLGFMSVTEFFANQNNFTLSQINLELTSLAHYKNKFYFAYNVLATFSWEHTFRFMYGISLNLGGSFYDKRNEFGQGWLAGMDIEFGAKTRPFHNPDNDSAVIVFTGINLRMLYRGSTRLGTALIFQILYEYNPFFNKNYDSHNLSIGPKIALIF